MLIQKFGVLALVQLAYGNLLHGGQRAASPIAPRTVALNDINAPLPTPTPPPEGGRPDIAKPPSDLAPQLASLAGAAPRLGGNMGMQGGMPYDRGRPRSEANITAFTGTGEPAVFSCWNSQLAWTTLQKEWVSRVVSDPNFTYPTTTVATKVVVTMLSNSSAVTSTRCDKVEYPPTSVVTPISLTFNEAWVSTITGFQTPHPTCVIDERKCGPAWDAFSTATWSYLSSVYSSHFAAKKTDIPGEVVFYAHQPPCPKPQTACPVKSEVDKCSLAADRATVFYWPTPVRDFCGEKAKVTKAATIQGQANTAVYKNMTITSPSVLVVVEGIRTNVQPPESIIADESELHFRGCGFSTQAMMQLPETAITSYRPTSVSVGTYRRSSKWATRYTISHVPMALDFADLMSEQVPTHLQSFAPCQTLRPRPRPTPMPRPGPIVPLMAAGPGEAAVANLGNATSKAVGWNGTTTATAAANGTTAATATTASLACPRVNLYPYRPHLSIPTQALSVAPEYSCSFDPILRDHQLVYVPITSATIGPEKPTHWGATVSVGPITASVGAVTLVRVPTPTPGPFPVGDFVPAWGDEFGIDGLDDDFGMETYGSQPWGEIGFPGAGKMGGGSGGIMGGRPSPPSQPGNLAGLSGMAAAPRGASGKSGSPAPPRPEAEMLPEDQEDDGT